MLKRKRNKLKKHEKPDEDLVWVFNNKILKQIVKLYKGIIPCKNISTRTFWEKITFWIFLEFFRLFNFEM